MIISLKNKNDKILSWINKNYPNYYEYFKLQIESEGKNYSMKKAKEIISLLEDNPYGGGDDAS